MINKKEGKIVMKKFYQCFVITLFLIVITQLAYADLHEGLVRCYRFFGNTNDISMNHISESGHNLVLTNDRFENSDSAYFFNGQDSYLNTQLNINDEIMPEISICAWVYPTKSDNKRTILSHDDGNYDRSLVIYNGFWHFYVGGKSINTNFPAILDTWAHAALIYDQNSVSFYLNEELFEYKNSTYTQSLKTLHIGKNPGHDENFEGIIDDIYIYNRVLSQNEVHQLYHNDLDIMRSSSYAAGEDANISIHASQEIDENTRALIYPDYGNKKAIIGNLNPLDDAESVSVSGTTAYVCCRAAGLKIVDISSLNSPELISTIYNVGWIARSGQNVEDLYYLAADEAGLQIIDVSNLEKPKLLSSIKIGENDDPHGNAKQVKVVDDYAYVAGYMSGLFVIDVHDPTQPVMVGQLDLNAQVNNLDVQLNPETYVYVTFHNSQRDNGLKIFQIIEPNTIQEISSIQLFGFASHVTVIDKIAYISNSHGGFHIIDVQDPNAPVLLSAVNFPHAHGISVINDHLYVVESGLGIHVYNLQDIESPQWEASIKLLGNYHRINQFKDYIIIAEGPVGIEIVDTKTELSAIGPQVKPYLLGSDIKIFDNNTAYFIETAGVHIIDIKNPLNPIKLGFCRTSFNASDIVIHDDIMYVLNSNYYLEAFNISNKKQPVFIKSFRLSETHSDHISMDMYEKYLYIGFMHPKKLVRFDTETWETTLTTETIGQVYSVKKYNDIIYTAESYNGMFSYKYNTLENTNIQLESDDKIIRSFDLFVENNTIYLTDDYGLMLFEIKENHIKQTERLSTPGTAWKLCKADDYVYIADQKKGIHIVDVSDPFSIKSLVSLETSQDARGVAIKDNYAFVADQKMGMLVLPLPFEITPSSFIENQLDLNIPTKGLPPGNYTIRLFNDQEIISEYYGEISLCENQTSKINDNLLFLPPDKQLKIVQPGTGHFENISTPEAIAHMEVINDRIIAIGKENLYEGILDNILSPNQFGPQINNWERSKPLPMKMTSPFDRSCQLVFHDNYVYVFGSGYDYPNVLYCKINEDGTLGDWTETFPFPNKFSDHFVVKSGNLIYLITGASANLGVYASKINDSGAIEEWQHVNNHLGAQKFAAVAIEHEVIYIVNSGIENSIVQYATINTDGTLSSWAKTTSLPEKNMHGHTMMYYDQYVYIISPSRNIYSSKILPDKTLDQWIETTSAPLKNNHFNSFIDKGYIYLQCEENFYFAKLNKGIVEQWKPMPSLPFIKYDTYAGAYNNKIYIIGGKNFRGDLTDSIHYASMLPKWEKKEDIEMPVSNYSFSTFNNRIYIIGGIDANGTSKKIVQIFDPMTGSWEETKTLNNMPFVMSEHSNIYSTIINGKIQILSSNEGNIWQSTYRIDSNHVGNLHQVFHTNKEWFAVTKNNEITLVIREDDARYSIYSSSENYDFQYKGELNMPDTCSYTYTNAAIFEDNIYWFDDHGNNMFQFIDFDLTNKIVPENEIIDTIGYFEIKGLPNSEVSYEFARWHDYQDNSLFSIQENRLIFQDAYQIPDYESDSSYTICVQLNLDKQKYRKEFKILVTNEFEKKALIVVAPGGNASLTLSNAIIACAELAYSTINSLDGYDIGNMKKVSTYNMNALELLNELDFLQDADEMLVYFVGHGEENVFLLNENDSISGDLINYKFNSLEKRAPCQIIFIYEACNSGNFLRPLSNKDSNRIIITSSDKNEDAYLLEQGKCSFSYKFWEAIQNGECLYTAFNMARRYLNDYCLSNTTKQHPLLDANGDGLFAPKLDLKIVKNMTNKSLHSPCPQHNYDTCIPDNYPYGPDPYDNNTYDKATNIHVKRMNENKDFYCDFFPSENDIDWFIFCVLAMDTYEIKIFDPGKNCDPIIALYHSPFDDPLMIRDYGISGDDEILKHSFKQSGLYYLKIFNNTPVNVHSTYDSEHTQYKIIIEHPVASANGEINGFITGNKYIAKSIKQIDFILSTDKTCYKGIYHCNDYKGHYSFPNIIPDTYILNVISPGYRMHTQSISVRSFDELSNDLTLTSLDSSFVLQSALQMIQMTCDMDISPNSISVKRMHPEIPVYIFYNEMPISIDVKNDNKIGLPEIIPVLKSVAW